jgi:hypothetical protein
VPPVTRCELEREIAPIRAVAPVRFKTSALLMTMPLESWPAVPVDPLVPI